MSNQKNTEIYEAAFEDFYELYFTSDSFASLIHEISWEVCDEYTKCGTMLKTCFDYLWDNDCELLVTDKRSAAEALLMYKKSMRQLVKTL